MNINASYSTHKPRRGKILHRANFASITTKDHETKDDARAELLAMIARRCDYRSTEVKIFTARGHMAVITESLMGYLDVRHVWPDGHVSLSGTDATPEQAAESFRAHVSQITWDRESLTSDILTTKETREEFAHWAKFQICHRYAVDVLGMESGAAHQWACDYRNFDAIQAGTAGATIAA